MNRKDNYPDCGESVGQMSNIKADHKDVFFECAECGCGQLNVTRRFVRVTHMESTLSCDCGEADDAAIRRYHTETLCEQTGMLDEYHQVDLDSSEELEKLATEDDEFEVFCSNCAESADEYAWQTDPYQIEVEETQDEFFVRCGGCQREIQFGWSHGPREGRIWPVECSDFNPWLGSPEPRFESAWHENGWLRPISVNDVAESLGCSADEARNLIESGSIERHPTCNELATDAFALKNFIKERGCQ